MYEVVFLYAVLLPLHEDISSDVSELIQATISNFPYSFLPVALFMGAGVLILSGLVNCAIAGVSRSQVVLSQTKALR